MLGFASISEAPISALPQAEANTLNLPVISSTETLYEPTVQIEWLLELPLLTNSSSFYTHALSLEATLPLLTNTSSLYSPSLQYVIDLAHLTNTSTLYSPEITSFTVYLPHLTSAEVLYPPSSSSSPTEVQLPHFTNTNQLFSMYEAGREKLVFTGVAYILE